MDNKPLIGIGLALLLLVIAVGLRYFAGGPSVKDLEYDVSDPSVDTVGDHHLHPQNTSVSKGTADHKGHDHDHHHHDEMSNVKDVELPEGLRRDLNERLKDNTRSDDLDIVTMPDGSKMSNLQGRFKHVPVAIKQPDGTTVIKEFYTAPGDNNPPQ